VERSVLDVDIADTNWHIKKLAISLRVFECRGKYPDSDIDERLPDSFKKRVQELG
jgi:hypothetical protein